MGTRVSRVFAAFAICLACALSAYAQNNWTHPRIISVMGTAEISVPPDEVTIALGVESHDKEIAVAKASNDRAIRSLLSLAAKIGVKDKDIQTSALNMEPEYSDERFPKLIGYQVSQAVTVTLTDLSKYEEFLTSALKSGVNRINGINFFVVDAKKYREKARLDAVKAAREKATAIATELGQTLGKPWDVSEDSNFEAEMYLTANKASFLGGLPGPQQGVSTLAGGEVTIRASVRVSFQLE